VYQMLEEGKIDEVRKVVLDAAKVLKEETFPDVDWRNPEQAKAGADRVEFMGILSKDLYQMFSASEAAFNGMAAEDEIQSFDFARDFVNPLEALGNLAHIVRPIRDFHELNSHNAIDAATPLTLAERVDLNTAGAAAAALEEHKSDIAGRKISEMDDRVVGEIVRRNLEIFNNSLEEKDEKGNMGFAGALQHLNPKAAVQRPARERISESQLRGEVQQHQKPVQQQRQTQVQQQRQKPVQQHRQKQAASIAPKPAVAGSGGRRAGK
jgi:hypothetical protein